jgi:type VI secretion system secreted protein Hcp
MFKNKRTAMVGTLVVAVFLSLLTFMVPGKALAAYDCFLKFSTIPGEAADDKHKDWIQIVSYSFGETQPAKVAASSGGARTAERVNMQDFKFTKVTDKTSPKLFLACANGEHIPEVKLEVCRSSGDKVKFFEIKLTNVIVSSLVNLGNSGSALGVPTEEISLNFGKIEVTYTQIDPLTGKPKGDIKAIWDLIMNKGN